MSILDDWKEFKKYRESVRNALYGPSDPLSEAETEKVMSGATECFPIKAEENELFAVLFRNPEGRVNEFDDQFLLMQNQKGTSVLIDSWPITTDPGLYWMEHPMNPKGCAIMVPGVYEYKLGLHRGKRAFVQAGPVKVYRDNNKDKIHDHDPKSIDEGYHAINIHGPHLWEAENVDRDSGGCMVFKRQEDITRCIWFFDHFEQTNLTIILS